MGRAAGKKRKLGAVTHDEVSGYTQTETLFKSNLFKLQTDELLREVAPFKAPLTRLEKALRELRTQLLALPAADVWWQRQKSGSPTASHPHLAHLALANECVHMTWHAPAKVDLVGSYLLRTVTAPELNVDVAVELPASMFLEKDYLDQRYADKRLLYLTHLAHLLSTAAASVVSASSPPRFIALPHMQAHNWPVLELTLISGGGEGAHGGAAAAKAPTSARGAGKKAKAAAATTEAAAVSGDAEASAPTEIRGWSVRLLPSLAADTLAPAKLRPQRCNLRCLGARPSAAYNNLVRLESQYARVLGLLHSTFSRDASGALRDAAVLLRVWLRQRDARQNGCLSGFQVTLLMVHLLHTRALSYSMGSYHVVRVVLSYLSRTGLGSQPIVLPPSPADEAAAAAAAAAATAAAAAAAAAVAREDEVEGEGEGGGQAGKAAAAAALARQAAAKEEAKEAASTLATYFPLVLADCTGQINFGCGVSAGALRELRTHATLALAALDTHALSDAAAFASLFTQRLPLSAAYDTVLTLSLPDAEADSPLPAGAGAVALPHGSPDDPTEGLAMLGLGAGGTGLPASAELAREVVEGEEARRGALCGGAAAVEALLTLGFGGRCEWVRAWRPRLAPWAPLQPAPAAPRTVYVGLLLHYSAAMGLVDKGPSPTETASVKAWTALWGELSSPRRFKDGAIVHAVVWDAPQARRHTVPLQIARHLLQRHLGVPSAHLRASLGAIDAVLDGPDSTGLGFTTAPHALQAFEALNRSLRNLVRCCPALHAHARTCTYTYMHMHRLPSPLAGRALRVRCTSCAWAPARPTHSRGLVRGDKAEASQQPPRLSPPPFSPRGCCWLCGAAQHRAQGHACTRRRSPPVGPRHPSPRR